MLCLFKRQHSRSKRLIRLRWHVFLTRFLATVRPHRGCSWSLGLAKRVKKGVAARAGSLNMRE